MGRTSLTVADIDRDVARRLESQRVKLGLSYRQLARKSEVSSSRLHMILTAERPMTVGDLEDIATALGLVGWMVMREAEESLRVPAPVSDLSALRARLESGQGVDAAALDPGYSPKDEQDPNIP